MRLQRIVVGVLSAGAIALATGCAKEVAAPIASAGADVSVNTGSAVQLDGSASSDPAKRLIRYEWRFLSVPTGSAAQLDDPTLAKPSFLPEIKGQYVVGLRVSNGVKHSAEDQVTVTVGSGAPTAVIATPASVRTGTALSLSGAGSTDPDEHLLYFHWSFASIPAGSHAALIGVDGATPSFVPDVAGDYLVRLVVDDGAFGNASEAVVATATVGSGAPTAAITVAPGSTVAVGTLVHFDGSTSSDPDQHLIHYKWSFVSLPLGSAAAFNDATSANPTFMPDVSGSYVASLLADDGAFGNVSAPANSTVMATGSCQPTANAGANQSGNQLASFQLDGSASSSPCGRLLSYAWSFTAMPLGSAARLNDPALPNPSFVADLPGSYVLALVASDSTGLRSAAANVTVTAGSCIPTANPISVIPGQKQGALVQLMGGTPTAPCGMAVTQWNWSFSSRPMGSLAALSSVADPNPVFTAEQAGDYVLKLSVMNAGGLWSPQATVSVPAVGSCIPTSDFVADSDTTVDGATSVLTSSGASPCGRTLSYAWSFVSVPAGSASAMSGVGAQVSLAPDRAGAWVVQLTTQDSAGLQSARVTHIVTAAASAVDLPTTGQDSSLALRGGATPAIAYYDSFDGDLKYAELSGVSWNRELVDFNGDVGSRPSLAITNDVAALPRISYYAAGATNLKYAEKNAAGAWSVITIDSGDIDDGAFSAIALDTVTNKPRIAYQATTNPGGGARDVLKYAKCDAADCTVPANWTKVVLVDPGAGNTVGWNVRMSLTAAGFPRFSFARFNPGQALVYGGCADATCATVNTATVDATAPTGALSMALTAAGDPMLVYYDSNNTNARFAACVNGAAASCQAGTSPFALQTIESTGDVGSAPGIAIASTGLPSAVWMDLTRGVIRYGTRSAGGVWTASDLVPANGASVVGFALSPADNPRLSYQGAGNALRFYRKGN